MLLQYNLNWFTVGKVITKIKRVNFLLRDSVVLFSIVASTVSSPTLFHWDKGVLYAAKDAKCF